MYLRLTRQMLPLRVFSISDFSLCILTKYPVKIETIQMDRPLCNQKGHRFPNNGVCMYLFLRVAFILANSEDPDEMPQNVAFHLSLHCLRK